MRRLGGLVALGAPLATVFGGCLVSFEDYPVGAVDGGAAAGGSAGTAGSGASGGSWAGSSGGGGTSGSAGAAANGGSSGSAAGAGGAGGTGGSAGAGGTSATGGTGGGTVDCKQYVWGLAGGTCYALGDVLAQTPSDCLALAGQGAAIVTCDAQCLLPNGGACQPMELASKVGLTDMCVVNDVSDGCTPFCSNTANYHTSHLGQCDASGTCSIVSQNCGNFICDPVSFECKTTCAGSYDCVMTTCNAGNCS